MTVILTVAAQVYVTFYFHIVLYFCVLSSTTFEYDMYVFVECVLFNIIIIEIYLAIYVHILPSRIALDTH